MKKVIKSTLGCMLGAVTDDEIIPGSEIMLELLSGDYRIFEPVYVKVYSDKTKAMNSNMTIWLS